MYKYQNMVKYYDLLYKTKSDDNEMSFLVYLINNRKTVLDVGCETGIHMNLLENRGYQVDGMDLSKSMLEIAKTRAKGDLFHGNLLNYDNYKELEKCVLSLYSQLNNN